MHKIILYLFIALILPVGIKANPVSENIKSSIELLARDKNYKIGREKLHSIEYISNLYAKNNYQPFWTETAYIEDAILGLTNSVNDGLLPQDYHLEAILALHYEIIQSDVYNEEMDRKKSDLDLLLTDGVIFYADHLLYGKIDPVSLEPTWNFEFSPIPDLNPETFRQYIIHREVPARLLELRPAFPMYDSLLYLLARYREIAGKGGWKPIRAGGKIEPGSHDPRIPEIRKRLLTTGELSGPDSVKSDYYGPMLEKDIKAFQQKYGLDADGIIGTGTFRELNIPVETRIETIRINMERARWVAGNMPENYIIVNIAAFWLKVVKNNELVHYTDVMVGKPLNMTPVFRDKMRYIDFNPTWTQPTSIVKNETIPKLKKDSAYLEKNHMVLLDRKGNLVPTADLDLNNLSPSRFPYLVRQEPGPWNALGEMKFMFPNKYDIYLHDTPSKSLFSKASRAYSHGCIRVSKPVDLALILLEGTEYDRKKINEILKTHETTRVLLPAPIDILLIYWTCGLDKNDKLFFVPDIYDRDPAIIKELDQLMR